MKLQNKVTSQTLELRHIPQRSCIACRDKKDKRDLIRLVYNSSVVEIDSSGKKTGRGAYLCSKFECWDLGLKQSRLDHALHTKLNTENRQALLEYARNLPKKEEIPINER
jgi:predicted RNA-binding protein YlxR (DUF448 family)